MADQTSHQASEAAAKANAENAKRESEALRKQQDEQRGRAAAAKPTPTQDENDRAQMGEHIEKHADDGSGPDPHSPEAKKK